MATTTAPPTGAAKPSLADAAIPTAILELIYRLLDIEHLTRRALHPLLRLMALQIRTAGNFLQGSVQRSRLRKRSLCASITKLEAPQPPLAQILVQLHIE
jgi:hypothetical protein